MTGREFRGLAAVVGVFTALTWWLLWASFLRWMVFSVERKNGVLGSNYEIEVE